MRQTTGPRERHTGVVQAAAARANQSSGSGLAGSMSWPAPQRIHRMVTTRVLVTEHRGSQTTTGRVIVSGSSTQANHRAGPNQVAGRPVPTVLAQAGRGGRGPLRAAGPGIVPCPPSTVMPLAVDVPTDQRLSLVLSAGRPRTPFASRVGVSTSAGWLRRPGPRCAVSTHPVTWRHRWRTWSDLDRTPDVDRHRRRPRLCVHPPRAPLPARQRLERVCQS